MTEPNIAVIVHRPSDVRVEEIPEPAPARDEAVVAIAYGGICGSDLHYWKDGAAGQSILREPMILGHEVSGTVVSAAADGSGPEAGAGVTVHPATAIDDGTTPWPEDRATLSPAGMYLGSAAHLPHTQGAFARRVALPSRMLHILPEDLSLRTAVAAEPTSVAWHAVERAGSVAGKRTLVVGAGPIGLLTVSVLRHLGAAEIVVSDMHERPLGIARELGADSTLDARDSATLDGLAADLVVEASGTVPGLSSAIGAAIRGGQVVMLGLQRAGDVPVPMATAITRELTVSGSFRFDAELPVVLAAMAHGTLDVEPVLTDEFPVQDSLAALERALDAGASSKVVIRF